MLHGRVAMKKARPVVFAPPSVVGRPVGWLVLCSGLALACGGRGAQTSGGSAAELQATEPPELVLGAPVAVTDPRLGVMGRTVNTQGGLELGYPGVTLRTCFTGAGLSLVASSNNGRSRFAVVVNGSRVGEFTLPQIAQEIPVWRAPAHDGGNGKGYTCGTSCTKRRRGLGSRRL